MSFTHTVIGKRIYDLHLLLEQRSKLDSTLIREYYNLHVLAKQEGIPKQDIYNMMDKRKLPHEWIEELAKTRERLLNTGEQ